MKVYCIKCRKKMEMVEPQAVTMRDGTSATRGRCRKCGIPMFIVKQVP